MVKDNKPYQLGQWEGIANAISWGVGVDNKRYQLGHTISWGVEVNNKRYQLGRWERIINTISWGWEWIINAISWGVEVDN